MTPLFMADIFEKRLIPNEGVVSGFSSQSYFYDYNPRTIFMGQKHCGIWEPKFGIFYLLKSKTTNFICLMQTSRRGFPQTVRADCVYLMNHVERLCTSYEPGRGTVYT